MDLLDAARETLEALPLTNAEYISFFFEYCTPVGFRLQ